MELPHSQDVVFQRLTLFPRARRAKSLIAELAWVALWTECVPPIVCTTHAHRIAVAEAARQTSIHSIYHVDRSPAISALFEGWCIKDGVHCVEIAKDLLELLYSAVQPWLDKVNVSPWKSMPCCVSPIHKLLRCLLFGIYETSCLPCAVHVQLEVHVFHSIIEDVVNSLRYASESRM